MKDPRIQDFVSLHQKKEVKKNLTVIQEYKRLRKNELQRKIK